MTEHLDTDLLARGAADKLCLNLTVDLSHLVHVQFACQHHDVCKLGIEPQCLDV